MRFQVRETTRHPRPVVFAAHRDELASIVAGLDGVRRVELLSEARRADGALVQVHLWTGSSAVLPALVRPFVPPALLQWRQETAWDPARWVAEWVIDVPGLGTAVEASGANVYAEEDAGCCIVVDGDFTFRPERASQMGSIPASVVPMVERVVVSLIVPLVQRSGAAVARYLDRR